MEITNPIKNYECEKCHVRPQPGVLIMSYKGFWLCGKCVNELIIKEKEENKKFIFEE